MKLRVLKWGNTLVLRIPKAFAAEAGLYAGETVDLLLSEDQLVVRAKKKSPPRLADLLEGVTPENVHGEIDWGPAVGGETW